MSRTSSSESANPQVRCTDSKRNAPVRDREDAHTLLPCPFCGGEAKSSQHGDVGYVVQCRRCGIWNAGYSAAWSHITEDEFNGFIDEESAIAAWNTRADQTCECESYGQHHKQVKRENDSERETCDARWHQLFGTPERAARTLHKDGTLVCRECLIREECEKTPEDSDCMITDYDALLEWLRGDA